MHTEFCVVDGISIRDMSVRLSYSYVHFKHIVSCFDLNCKSQFIKKIFLGVCCKSCLITLQAVKDKYLCNCL
jgi:hypothetical protein